MKKLFFAFMIAAAGLLASCNQTGGPKEDPNPGNKPFYGFTMDAAEVTYIGEDEYIIQLYSIAGNQLNRLFSAQITIPGVDLSGNDVLLPEGTYELAEGFLSDDQTYLVGSFYQNYIAETPYIALVNEGVLEIKHTSKGYRMTIWSDGENVKDGTPIEDVECRYEGDAVVYGNTITVDNAADAFYCGLYEGVPYWVMQLYTPQNMLIQLYLNTTSDVFEEGIPTAKYPFNYTFEAGNADASYTNSNGSVGGSCVMQLDDEGSNVVALIHEIYGGYVDLKNNGENYTINIRYYNQFYVPYTISFEGKVNHVDDSDSGQGQAEDYAQAVFMGNDAWMVYLGWAQVGLSYGLEVYNQAGTPMEEGLVDGTYTVADTAAEMTIMNGYLGGDGYVYGSFFGKYDLSGTVYDLIVGGTMTFANNGDGTYSIEVDFENGGYSDMTGVTSWSYEGEVKWYDGTQNGVAPAKAPAKFSGEKLSRRYNTKNTENVVLNNKLF